MRKLTAQIGWAGKNYTAITENINGVVVSTSDTLQGIKTEIATALDFHIEGLIEDGDPIPKYIANRDFELRFELLTSAMLKQLDGTVTRSALSRATNINERQLGHYIQGKIEARPSTKEKIVNGIRSIIKELEYTTS